MEGEDYLGMKEVAEKTGLAASTIRYYDQQFSEYLGIERGAGRRRRFSPQALERLAVVHRMLKEEGLSIRQVRQALAGDAPSQPGLNQCLAQIQALGEEVASLRAQVAELKDIQRRTLGLIDGLTS